MRTRFLFATLSLAAVHAQAGVIRGVITDEKTGTPLTGVGVTVVDGGGRGAATDLDGNFLIVGVPAGKGSVALSYIGYTKASSAYNLASEADTVTLTLTMKAEGTQSLKGVTVRSARKTNSESAVLMEIKKSNVVVSGISAAQIGRTMDRNAAEVVRRVPGVTIQDDRFITVRGLADRYNTVWLNDAGAPSSEADKKAFSFDILPSGVIDRILVFKTPSPELPGDFAGGMVKIYTTSIPEKATYSFNVQSSYRSGTTGTDFNYAPKGGTDWLGYDNGTRALPGIVPATPVMDPATGSTPVLSADPNISAISKSFGNDFTLSNKKAPLDLRLNGSASNSYKVGKAKIGGTLAASYTSTYTNYNVDRNDYDDTVKQNHLNDLVSAQRVNVGALANFALAVGNTKIEFKNLFSQIGNSTAIYRTSVVDSGISSQVLERAYSLGYDSRRTYSTQLTGSHHNNSDSRRYTWTLGYADFFRNQPNIRRLRYTESTPGVYQTNASFTVDPYNGGSRYYATLQDKTYSFNHQFTQKFGFIRNFEFDLNVGNYIEYKKRDFRQRIFGYVNGGTQNNPFDQTLLSLPVDQIFAPANVGEPGRFLLEEDSDPSNSYSATNRLIASYVSLSLPITSRFKAVGGVRYEDNQYQLDGSRNFGSEVIKPEVKTNFLLPSVNLTYNFSPKSLLRAAYGQTINRPEFRETTPLVFYDFERRANNYGALYQTSFSPNGDTLKVARIHNVDARYEFYPSNGEVIQIGGFYKKFQTPIQQVIYYVAGQQAFTYINAKESYIYGAEIELRKNLQFLDDRLNTRFLSNFTAVCNVALSKSELTIDTTRYTDVLPTSRLEGQSDYVINAGLFYQNDSTGWQGSVLYNVYGPRLYAIGTIDDPSVGELAFHSLDALISKRVFKNFQVNFGVQNLLDQQYRFVIDANRDSKFSKNDDRSFNSFRPGRYFTLGLRWRI